MSWRGKEKEKGQIIRGDIDKDLNVQTWKIIGWLWMIQEYQYCAYHCVMKLHVIEFKLHIRCEKEYSLQKC